MRDYMGVIWEIKRYTAERREEWDSFVEQSRNATFLFIRDYMDYHSDRFADFSLLAYRNGKLSAILPANLDGEILYSHQGLTYGGWLLPLKGLDVTDIWELWKEWMRFCMYCSIRKVVYKTIPYIYTKMPSEEDLYLLFLSGANLISSNISTAIDLHNNPGFNKLQNRHLKSAEDQIDIVIANSLQDNNVVDSFHRLLSRCLHERHNTSPVHNLEELRLLMKRFQDNIYIWNAYSSITSELMAAICVYETTTCIHCQYIATSPKGRDTNALATLVYGMIRHYTWISEKGSLRYLDFGISNEKDGKLLNKGLNRQKTSYGGSGVAYQQYEINVACASKQLSNELWPSR